VLVKRLGFTATVPDPQIVGHEMNEWALHFLSWLDILTGQHLKPVGFRPLQQVENRTCLMTREDGTLTHTPVFRPLPRTYPLTQLDATEEMLEHCCGLAGAKEPVPLAWMLLRDARALHRVGQTRRAVIECGSAGESAVKALLSSHSVPIKKALTLGPLSERLEKDGYPLASDLKTAFLSVRNREVHMNPGWGSVSEAESLRMLEIATELVEDAFPLPRGIKRLW
jgi:HEPN domain-containing protein